jgi:formamidopyrimidine-DNA glycosylase
MAEWPELTILQRQMNEALSGRAVAGVEITQEKCLNIPVAQAREALAGSVIQEVSRVGKWLRLHLDGDRCLLLNLGMGADLWYYEPESPLPGKYQLRIHLDNGAGFTCRFWWFGYIRLLTGAELAVFPETAKLGPDPMTLSGEAFAAIARRSPRSTVKSLILDQTKVSGIGNAYAHDILWTARLHPQRRLGTLAEADLGRYHQAIRQVLNRGLELGGLENDFFNQGGNMANPDFFLVGYREGKPCPACGTGIIKVQTGATATFLCPACQVETPAEQKSPD